jgi:hypothetical protein
VKRYIFEDATGGCLGSDGEQLAELQFLFLGCLLPELRHDLRGAGLEPHFN